MIKCLPEQWPEYLSIIKPVIQWVMKEHKDFRWVKKKRESKRTE